MRIKIGGQEKVRKSVAIFFLDEDLKAIKFSFILDPRSVTQMVENLSKEALFIRSDI